MQTYEVVAVVDLHIVEEFIIFLGEGLCSSRGSSIFSYTFSLDVSTGERTYNT